jgi:predicted transcriptional regulator
MEKSVNYTVRISPELKAQAEEACKYLDLTVSEVVRKALRQVVKQYQTERAKDTADASRFMDGETAQAAYDVLVKAIDSKGGEVEILTGSAALSHPVRNPPQENAEYVQSTYKQGITPRVNEAGEIDPATMTRKLRRQYARDKAKGRV